MLQCIDKLQKGREKLLSVLLKPKTELVLSKAETSLGIISLSSQIIRKQSLAIVQFNTKHQISNLFLVTVDEVS